MLRRKLGTTVQVGLRIREELRRQLEAAAEEHHLSFNQELTARLEASLEHEARQSLDSAAKSLTRDARRFEKLTEVMWERLGLGPPPPPWDKMGRKPPTTVAGEALSQQRKKEKDDTK
jgi:hypothetical protein